MTSFDFAIPAPGQGKTVQKVGKSSKEKGDKRAKLCITFYAA